MSKGMFLSTSVLTILATQALAETYRTIEGVDRVFQMIETEKGMYCRRKEFGAPDCAVVDVLNLNGNHVFTHGPFGFEVKPDDKVMTVTHLETNRETSTEIKAVSNEISGSRFSGLWGASAESWYQLTSLDRERAVGEMTYSFRGFPLSKFKVTVTENVFISRLSGGIVFYFLQVPGGTFAIRYAPDTEEPATVWMEEEPFEFSNEAQCAQAHLNYLGFDVGRADGQPGPKSRAGSVAYLEENPVELEPLTRGSADQWCSYLSEKVDVSSGVVALEGMR